MKRNFTILMLLAFCCLGMNAKKTWIIDHITPQLVKSVGAQHKDYVGNADYYGIQGESGAVYDANCIIIYENYEYKIQLYYDYPDLRGLITKTSPGTAKKIIFHYSQGNEPNQSMFGLVENNSAFSNVNAMWNNVGDQPLFTYAEGDTKLEYNINCNYINFYGYGDYPNLSCFKDVEVLWDQVEVDHIAVPIGAAGISTFCFEHDLDFTDLPVKAWVANLSDDGKSVILTQVQQVPGGVGVIVTADEEGSYDVPIISGATLTESSDLIGVTSYTGGEVKQYENGKRNFILLSDGSNVSFHPLASDYIHKLPARKAYLSALEPVGAHVVPNAPLKLVFDEEEVTGIEAVNCEEVENGDVYNLQGIKVDSNYKGFVIKNGKKFYNR